MGDDLEMAAALADLDQHHAAAMKALREQARGGQFLLVVPVTSTDGELGVQLFSGGEGDLLVISDFLKQSMFAVLSAAKQVNDDLKEL